MKELVRAEERAALAQAEGQLESLELQIEDHRRRENELEQLSHTEDHIHFLQVTAEMLLQRCRVHSSTGPVSATYI